MLRDCREFYRILWKNRYGHVKEEKLKWVPLFKNFFKELGLNENFGELHTENYITFCYRVLKFSPKEKSEYNKRQLKIGPMKVFKKYNVKDRDVFLTHPVFSRLYLFLYYTFFPLYLKETKEEFKKMVCIELINVFNNCLNE